MHKRITALLVLMGLVFSGCTSKDPLGTGSEGAPDNTITIGTANFPESEIIGQYWAKILTDAGFNVDMASGIGSREVYMQALEEGAVDIVPEYTGNLAQFLGAEVKTGSTAEQIYEQLEGVLPPSLSVGKPAPAESKDSYTVTKEFAKEHSLKTIEDLSRLGSFTLAANPEFAERPYGPQGLADIYKLAADKIEFKPIADGGGPLTIEALKSGDVEVADIYTTSPQLDSDGNRVDVMALDDPKNLVPAQSVLPVVRSVDVPREALEALNKANAQFTTKDLLAMNERNIGTEKAEPAVIVRDYIAAQK